MFVPWALRGPVPTLSVNSSYTRNFQTFTRLCRTVHVPHTLHRYSTSDNQSVLTETLSCGHGLCTDKAASSCIQHTAHLWRSICMITAKVWHQKTRIWTLNFVLGHSEPSQLKTRSLQLVAKLVVCLESGLTGTSTAAKLYLNLNLNLNMNMNMNMNMDMNMDCARLPFGSDYLTQ